MKHDEKQQDLTLEERLKRVERILGLRPHGDLVFSGQATVERSIPGPHGTRLTATVGTRG
jgi:hypothetical protein